MIATIAGRLALAWLACAVVQLALWLVARRTRNAGIVDVGWALSFAIIACVFAATATNDAAAWLPIAIAVAVWSVRLGGYLIARGAATGPEEGRYATLRAAHGAHADRFFLVFFQAQAALAALLAIAFVVPFVVVPDSAWPRALGTAIALAGVCGEATADAQLARHRRDPARRGRVCDVGLWAWSRHPNYFFEWCVWIGYAVYGLAFLPWGAVAWIAQGIIVASIFGVTGIPPTEKQAIASRGDAYRAYQARVSRFVPRPPKRTPSG